jgi:hypothetical protein
MVRYLKERNGKALSKVVYEHKKRVFDKLRKYLQKNLEPTVSAFSILN